DVDSQGQVLPGTVHKTQLEMVTWPSESPIDITDPGLDVEAAGLMISAALSRAVDAFGSGGAQYMLLSCEPVHPVPQVEPAPEGWARLWRRGGGAAGAAAADAEPGTPDDADDQPAVSDEQLRMPAVLACAVTARIYLTDIRVVSVDLA